MNNSACESSTAADLKATPGKTGLKKSRQSLNQLMAEALYDESQKTAIFRPQDYKIVSLRECSPVNEKNFCDNPSAAWQYWLRNVELCPYFNPDCECLVVILLNTRRKAIGHTVVSVGLVDTILVHSRELFRCAIIGNASAVIMLHNHPSGDPEPSPADIKVTREVIRAGELLKIEVLDHVIIGEGKYASLRELGYFEQPRIEQTRSRKVRMKSDRRTGVTTVQT